jgi:hypothetical protein
MSLNPAISDLRQDYRQAALLESEADPNPIDRPISLFGSSADFKSEFGTIEADIELLKEIGLAQD